MGNCGCECGCWGVCYNHSYCEGNACNTCSLPTCGCGQTVSSGETCLNQPYYLVVTNAQTNEEAYFQFNFGYCILTILSGTGFSNPNECIQQWMWIYYNLDGSYLWYPLYLTTTLPSGLKPATTDGLGNPVTGYGYAQNAFLWAVDVTYLSKDPFTSYAISGCNTQFPTSTYPSCSANW
jgi:hypothetical protein